MGAVVVDTEGEDEVAVALAFVVFMAAALVVKAEDGAVVMGAVVDVVADEVAAVAIVEGDEADGDVEEADRGVSTAVAAVAGIALEVAGVAASPVCVDLS